MSKLRILVSLTTHDNDYQIEQAGSAEQAARKHGVDLQIIYAGNDAINQSTQLLKTIQSSEDADRPNAIIFEPVGGTALPQVARAAVDRGIGWVVLNREANYVPELRQLGKAPVFTVTVDHAEMGRIQARQCSALLPKGGTVLYIQGPSENSAAQDRLKGMQELKPASLHLILLKGQWTEESAQRAMRSWLKLSTARKTSIDLVAAQNDAMAMGIRKAFQEVANEADREHWLSVPFIGIDGLPKTGQSWVRSGLLRATIFNPPNTGQAIDLMVEALQKGKSQPELVRMEPVSIPPLDALRRQG
jgi:ribose transport system substrate-binding protein